MKTDTEHKPKNVIKKSERLGLRIRPNDLIELKRLAEIEGIPYQTFISSVLHKFVNGTIKRC